MVIGEVFSLSDLPSGVVGGDHSLILGCGNVEKGSFGKEKKKKKKRKVC